MTSSHIETSHQQKWTVEMRMYLLAYFIHVVKTQGLEGKFSYKSARQALLTKFDDGHISMLSERAIEAAIQRISYKYRKTTNVQSFKAVLLQYGIDTAALRIPLDEKTLVREYLSEYANTGSEAPVVQIESDCSVSQNKGRTANESHLDNALQDEYTNRISSHTELASLRNTSSSALQPALKRRKTSKSSCLPSKSNPEAANEALDSMVDLAPQGIGIPEVPGQLLRAEHRKINLKLRLKDSKKQHEATRTKFTRLERVNDARGAKIAERDGEIESNKQLLMEHEFAQKRAPVGRQDPVEASFNEITGYGRDGKSCNCENRSQQVLDGMLRTLWIPRESDNSLDPADVACVWNKCEEFLAAIFVDCVLRQPSAVDSTQVAQDFSSFLVKLFGTTEVFSIYEPGTAIRSLDPSYLRRILQAYAMDLLCEKIFLHDGWYNSIFGGCTSGMLAQMRRIISATTGGMQILRELDANAFKLTLEERRGHLNDSFLPVEAKKFAEQVCEKLEPFFAEPPKIWEERLQACAKSLMELKFELLITPKQYIIEWTPAGVVFDSDSMESKHSDGDGKELQVKLCFHPAMKEYDAAPITHFEEGNFESVLTCKKSLFRKQNMSLKNEVVVAKSMVLLNPATDRYVQSASHERIVVDG